VVTVQTEVVQRVASSPADFFFGTQSGQQLQAGIGSGFIIREDGVIVTNAHVVSGASKISVALRDGTSYPATLLGIDDQNDLAVLKITAPASKLTPLTLADVNAMEQLPSVRTAGAAIQTSSNVSYRDKRISAVNVVGYTGNWQQIDGGGDLYPGRNFTATLAASANSVASASGTIHSARASFTVVPITSASLPYFAAAPTTELVS